MDDSGIEFNSVLTECDGKEPFLINLDAPSKFEVEQVLVMAPISIGFIQTANPGKKEPLEFRLIGYPDVQGFIV